MGSYFSCFSKKHSYAEPDSHPNKNPIMYYLQGDDVGLNQNDLLKLSNFYPGVYSTICPSYCPVEDVYKTSKTNDTLLVTVADGHHGSECSHFTISVLHDVLGYLLQHMSPVNALESSHLILDEFILNIPFYLDLIEFKNHYNLEMQIGHALDTPLRMGKKTNLDQFNPVFNMDLNAIGISLSGATSLTAMVTNNPRKLYVANVGDSSAVLVRLHHNKEYSAYKITSSHTAKSTKEYERLIRQHPNEEKTLAGVNGYGEMRLLGVLIPTRSFGDSILKWQTSQSQRINKLLRKNPSVYSANIKRSAITEQLVEAMKTPPYLTAKPEIYVRDIEENEKIRDKYLILATDGIWDKISPEMASYLTIHALEHSELNGEIKVASFNNKELYDDSMPKIHPCLLDNNPATAILRYCLGGDDESVTLQLNYNYPQSRQKRDDCTVVVIDLQNKDYFKSDFKDDAEESSEAKDNGVVHKIMDVLDGLEELLPKGQLGQFEKVSSEQSIPQASMLIQDIINDSLKGKNISKLNSSSLLNEQQEISMVNEKRGEYLVNALFA
eukprot:NODE_246_length_12992_cov_0.264407.p1 type:complete len:553 gc:universal NODE_246_length_12992_cov_0.264407:2724-4382(+)